MSQEREFEAAINLAADNFYSKPYEKGTWLRGARWAYEYLQENAAIAESVSTRNQEPASHTAQESRGEWSEDPPKEPGVYWYRSRTYVETWSEWSGPRIAYAKQSDLYPSAYTLWWSIPIPIPSTEPPVPQTVNVEEEK